MDSTNKTIELLTAFYSGMGTSIDAVDLSTEVMDTVNNADAVGADSTNTEELISVADKIGDNEVVTAIRETTDAVEQFKQEAAAKFSELIISGELQQKLNFETLGASNAFLSQISDNTNQINNYINTKEETQPVINVHYDSLLTVNGNVDKNALPDLQTILEQAYRHTTEKIYNNQKILGSVRKVIR